MWVWHWIFCISCQFVWRSRFTVLICSVFVKNLEYMAGIMYMNNHLKCGLGFRGIFDISFLFIVEIWYDVQKGSLSTLRSMYCQIFSVSPASSDLVDLCPNISWNNPKETLFLIIFFCDFVFSFVLNKNAFFSVRCKVMSPRSFHYQ